MFSERKSISKQAVLCKKKKERREKINFLMSYFKIGPFESKR